VLCAFVVPLMILGEGLPHPYQPLRATQGPLTGIKQVQHYHVCTALRQLATR
jgi:hypothetical protein